MKQITVRMELMGRCAVFVNGNFVDGRPDSLSKHWQVFCLLVIGDGAYVPEEQILEAMWPNAAPEEAASRLCTVLGDLYVQLDANGEYTKAACIEHSAAGYRIGRGIIVSADFVEFYTASLKVYGRQKSPVEELLCDCYAMITKYKGRFFHTGEPDCWMRRHAMGIDLQYRECVCHCLRALMAESLYEQLLLMYATVENEIEPCDEMMVLWYEALLKLEKHEAVVEEYPELIKRFDGCAEDRLFARNEIEQIYRKAIACTA